MRRAVLGILLVLALLAPSPALAEPPGLEVTGWALDSASKDLVVANADGISTLSVVGATLRPDGGNVVAPTRGATWLRRVARRQGLRAELLISNYSNRLGDFDPHLAHSLLANPANRSFVAVRLAHLLDRTGWDGVNVDLERVPRRDAAGLTAFVRELQAVLPAEATVTVDVSGSTSRQGFRSRGYQLAALGRAADVVKLMTYDYSGPTWSGPGPIGPLPWQRKVVETALRLVPREKLDLGVAGYAYTWPRHGTGRSISVARARTLVRDHGAQARWHRTAGEWSATLSNGTRLWWSDRRSYRHRVALAQEYGLHGLAVWRLGSADTLT
jgi:spore germination protein YaaH